MGILLLLAQVVLAILVLVAHAFTLNAWLVWMPAILFGALWATGIAFGCRFVIDRFTNIYAPVRRSRR